MKSRMAVEQQLDCGVRIRVSCVVRMWKRCGDICCTCIKCIPLGEKGWTNKTLVGDCFPDRREIRREGHACGTWAI